MIDIGSRVRITSLKAMRGVVGTVIQKQPALFPFVTERASIPARFKVMWDGDWGESGFIPENELIEVG